MLSEYMAPNHSAVIKTHSTFLSKKTPSKIPQIIPHHSRLSAWCLKHRKHKNVLILKRVLLQRSIKLPPTSTNITINNAVADLLRSTQSKWYNHQPHLHALPDNTGISAPKFAQIIWLKGEMWLQLQPIPELHPPNIHHPYFNCITSWGIMGDL